MIALPRPYPKPKDIGNCPPRLGLHLQLHWQSPDGVDWEELEDSVTAATYTDGSMSEGTHRYYRVSAYNNNGAGNYGGPAGATTAPAAPSGLSASAVSSGEINLHWTDNSSHETAYAIQRRPTGDPQSVFSTVATLDANARYYSDVGLVQETAYSYRVRAVANAGSSEDSNTANATTPETPEGENPDGGEWVSTGASASPSTSSGAHHSFGNFNAGRYRVMYQSGAINFYKYTSAQWGIRGSFTSNGSEVGTISCYPYNSAGEASQAAQGANLVFEHPGGSIEVYLDDSPYEDNSGGNSFSLDHWVPDDDPQDPDPKPTVSIGVTTAGTTEGDAETPLVFTFTRSGRHSSATTVYYTLSGIARPGLDYSPQSDFDTIQSVSIPGGGTSASAQVQVNALADDLWEGDEPVKLSLRSNSNYWLGGSRSATGTIQDVAVNLAVDSNNNGVIGQGDEAIEDDAAKPGVIVSVNADDADSDGVPDWADGYGRFSDTPILEAGSSTRFVPVTVTLSNGVDLSAATVEFDYEASDPQAVTRSGSGTEQDPYVYALPTAGGSMRLWTKNGSQGRDGKSAGAGGD